MCDVVTGEWKPLPIRRRGDDLRLALETNWALVVLRKPGGPALVSFADLPPAAPGATVTLQLSRVLGDAKRPVRIVAPGLEVSSEATIRVPVDALPGHYAVRVAGRAVLGVKRFLTVTKPPAP